MNQKIKKKICKPGLFLIKCLDAQFLDYDLEQGEIIE